MAQESTTGLDKRLSRRGVLGAGVAIPVGLAAASAGASATGASATPMQDMHAGVAPTTAPPPAAGAHPPPVAAPGLEGLETLNAIEMDALEAFCARLIPSDDQGPGAKEARAAHYIDRALAGPLMSLRPAYAAGLSALDAYARSSAGQLFAHLTPAQQDAVLHDLESGKATGFTPDSSGFFRLVRAHVIEGTFCDPYYGGNANFIGWDMVGYPGLRMLARAQDQRLVKPKTLRQSAYSANMFGRGPA